MVKSKSAYIIKKKCNSDAVSDTIQKRKVDFGATVKSIPHEPISVPNFSMLTLPTPTLTPVEAARLVFLDTDEENDLEINTHTTKAHQDANLVKRGESYSSHLGYVGNPLYQHMLNPDWENGHEVFNQSVSSTSDYASIETVNKLSSVSNASEKIKEGLFGFCNPNYMGPDIKSMLNGEERKHAVKFLNTPDSLLEDDDNNHKGNILEMQSYNEVVTRCLCKKEQPHKPLLHKSERNKNVKSRASSASRIERSRTVPEQDMGSNVEPFVPLYIYVVGGKEKGQVTVFQRPLSIWKLKIC